MGTSVVQGRPYLQVEDGLAILGNESILLAIELGKYANPCAILDRSKSIYYADTDYLYSLVLDGKHRGGRLKVEDVSTRYLADGSLELTIPGKIELTGKAAPDDIAVIHRFIVPPNKPHLDERISVINAGDKTYEVDNVRFGFRKALFRQRVARGFSRMNLYSVPFQRYWGQRIDRERDVFTMSDLTDEKVNIPGYASEGWMLTDGRDGFLVAKHSINLIEFSVLDRRKSKSGVDMVFGGVGFYRGDPEEASVLEPRSRKDFGTTRYMLFEGGFNEGCYVFRDYMDSMGHVAPRGYRPKVFWNVLYDLDCKLTDPKIKPYPLEQLRQEAALAKELGCEALYLDPQWDTVMGSTVWDKKRLGDMRSFVTDLKKKYGLDLALHLMMNTDSSEEYRGCYRVDKKRRVHKWANLLCGICPPTRWQEMKKARVSKLCEAGTSWVMFDFTDFDKGTECWDANHPHHVPLRRCEHAGGIFNVIRHIKEEFPDVTVEAHDRITSGPQDYHQMHYQHTPPTFDEGWAFEMMWDSMGDLMSGKAFSLYSYRMCYSLPQYLHFNLSNDNDNLLCFWWFASTVRHIGVGGLPDRSSLSFRKAKREMKRYKRLRDFYVHGVFYGINPTCHVHVLPRKNRAVINVFNLTKRAKRIIESINLSSIGIDPKRIKHVPGGQLSKKRDTVTVTLDMPPLSPAVLELK